MYHKYGKRALDLFIAISVSFIFLPIFILIILLIKFSSKGPIFFKQNRPGKKQKIFGIYKFRTMVRDAVKKQKVGVEVIGHDDRITFVGKSLRRFKIDEIAQLINVLKGEMSIVGPRPTLPEYIEKYEKWELERFDVKPGLTGLAQINGNIFLERKEKSGYDVKYVENISFYNDLKIIVKTIGVVLFGEEKFINKIKMQKRKENLDK